MYFIHAPFQKNEKQNADRDVFEQHVNDSDDISLSRVKRTDVSETVPINTFSENKKISRARRSGDVRSTVDRFETDVIFPRTNPKGQVILSRVKRRHL